MSVEEPWFEGERLAAFRDYWTLHTASYDLIVERSIGAHEALVPAIADPAFRARALEMGREDLAVVRAAHERGDWRALRAYFLRRAESFAQLGIDFDEITDLVAVVQQHSIPLILEAHGGALGHVALVLAAMNEFWRRACSLVRHRYKSELERLAAEQAAALRRSEARFARLVDAGIFGVMITDLSGRILEANDEVLRMLGYTRADLDEGRLRWDELTPPEWKDLTAELVATLRRAGVVAAIEKEYFRKDGTRVAVLVGSASLEGDQQITFVLDISRQRRTAEALARTERVFRAIVQTSPDALSLLTREGVFLYASPAAAAVGGRPGESLIGRDVHELIQPEDLPVYRQRWQECIDHPGVRFRHEFRMRLPGGGSRYAESLRTNYLDDPDIGAIVTVVRDISDRHALEVQLGELDAFNRAVFDVVGALVVVLDRNARVVLFNPACESVTGWPSSEVVGRPFFDVFVPEEQQGETRAAFANLAAGQFPSWLENDWLTRDGRRRWIAWANSCILDADGEVKFVVGTGIDRTPEREAEVAMREMNTTLERRVSERTRDLEAANADLESFAYSVSHDLRAPLRAIDGYSKIILDEHGAAFDEHARKHFARIRQATARMSNLIDGLLVLARASRRELVRVDVDLSALARDIHETLARAEPNRRVDVTIAPELRCHADATLARAVLENLLGNAWKYTSERAHAHITVGKVEGAASPTFFVEDDGIGFDPAHAGQLFQPFQRLHSRTDFAGDGIGLATVQRIVRRHQGTVEGVGRVGKGATFRFSLG